MIELAHWLLLSVANVPDRVVRLRRLRVAVAAALAILAAAAALAILLVAAVHSLGAASAAPTSEIDRTGDDQTLAIAPLGGQVEAPATSHSTVPGRLFVRVRALPRGNDGGAWRIEFGFLPDSILYANGASGRSAAVQANTRLLPSSRFVSEATLRSRERTNNRRWLVSTPVRINLSGSRSVQGRVIARWNPKSGGDFRVEFGWLPEQARQAAGGNSQAAVAANGAVLPSARYLNLATILSRAAQSPPRWLFSASIDVPVTGGGGGGGTPVISWRGYPSDGASVGAALSPLGAPTATVDGRPVQLRYRYSAAPTSVCGVDASGRVQLRTAGVCRVTATSVAGTYPSASKTVTVGSTDPPSSTPVISWRGYPTQGASVGATLSPLSAPTATVDGRPVQLRYRYGATPPGVCGVDASGRLQLRTAGVCRVTATSVAGTYPSASKTVTVQLVAQPKPVISWPGYPTQGASVGATLSPLSAPTATVEGRPVQLRYRYGATPPGVCGVNLSGQLQLRTAGVCRVTATSVAGTYAEASKTVTVQVVTQPKPVISWRGYPSDGASVGATLSPLSAPTATVAGRPVQLRYRYGAVPTGVCGVDASGRLQLRTAGVCRVTATSEAGTYAEASKTVTVQVVSQPPVITWRGYPTQGASVGATLSPLSAPTATVAGRPVQLRYRYGAVPTGVCGVDARGRLQLRTAGVCRVTVTSAAGTYAEASKTVTVQVVSQPPVITWRGYPSSGASVGQTLSPLSAPTATVNGRPVQLQYRYGAVPTGVCGVDASGRLQLRTAGVCRVTATSVAGTYPSASKTVTVQVVQPQPVITWRGYPSSGASVGQTLSPLSAPTAMVGGRPVSLQYRYSAAPSSVCQVNSSGTLTPLSTGNCRVTATSVAGTYAPASAPAVTVRITRSKPVDPPASGFAYCGGDTIKVWYFERSAGTRHHLDITWQEANATFVESWWSTIGNMSDSDCGTWRTGRDYGLSDAERVADQRGIRAPKTRATPPASGFAYCGGDTIRVYYFHSSAGTRHHLSITWQEANATFGASWWNTIENMTASDCATWPLGRVYYLRDAQGLPGAAPAPPTGGGTSGGGGTGGTQPPLPLPEPPASRLARCDGDTIRVWYFHPSAGTKHHLDLTWEQAVAIFGSSWGNTIGNMSASDCARWTTGSAYGVSDARRIPR